MNEDDLRARFGGQAVDALIALLKSGQTPEIEPQMFEARLAESGIEVRAVQLLDAAAEANLVERISTWRCTNPSCRRVIDSDDVANRRCSHCGTDFRETGDDPVEAVVYRGSTALSRSVP